MAVSLTLRLLDRLAAQGERLSGRFVTTQVKMGRAGRLDCECTRPFDVN